MNYRMTSQTYWKPLEYKQVKVDNGAQTHLLKSFQSKPVIWPEQLTDLAFLLLFFPALLPVPSFSTASLVKLSLDWLFESHPLLLRIVQLNIRLHTGNCLQSKEWGKWSLDL